MDCLKFLNSVILVKSVLLTAVLILGFFQIQNIYANVLNEKACREDDKGLAIDCLYKAISLNDKNPLYYANSGLIYARMDTAISLKNYYAGKIICSKELDKALNFFHCAELLKVNDPLFCFNLGLLYALKGEPDKAIAYLEKASADINDEWYSVLSAFLYEKYDRQKAKEYYTQALLASPDLATSLLFAELMSRDSLLAGEIQDAVKVYLQPVYNKADDPVKIARFAKVLLDTGDKARAEVLFHEVTEILPGLSRPWLYLGSIAEQCQDTLQARLCYQRAEILDVTDVLTFLYKNRLGNKVNYMSEVDTLLKYRLSERNLIYRNLFNASLLQNEMVINDFDRYQRLYKLD